MISWVPLSPPRSRVATPVGGRAPLPLGRQLLLALCPQSPPLRDGAGPEGSTSMGVAPTGVAYANRHRACMCRPCPRAVVLAGSSIGCRRPWPQLVAPAGNQATAGLPCRCLDVGGRPYRGHGHGRPPLQVAWP
ncbi:hypothetical protein BHM03_00046275 [Ensete ventricosum]|nr:hypothetical protein BHM03_00046275 [Ensete ventricosum]